MLQYAARLRLAECELGNVGSDKYRLRFDPPGRGGVLTPRSDACTAWRGPGKAAVGLAGRVEPSLAAARDPAMARAYRCRVEKRAVSCHEAATGSLLRL